MPMIIVERQNSVKLMTVMTGFSHFPAFHIRIRPSMQVQMVQSRKLPSCASQIRANIYCIGIDLLECSQAKLYSKRWLEMIYTTVASTAKTEKTSIRKAWRAIRRQLFSSSGVLALVALK